MEVNEYNIPVPWGHVTVKAWGNKSDTPVLVGHGVQDNAGIFDSVIPLLPKCFYYMCIDLPSHGKSSHFPTTMHISQMDGVIAIKLILDYLNRKKYILLGHSWSAQIFVIFTHLYPEYVLKLCLIDGFYTFPLSVETYKMYWNERIESLIKINENIKNKVQPLYTYEEALEKITTSRMYGEITEATAKRLLNRCLVQTPSGKYALTTDPRLRVFLLSGHDLRYQTELAKTYPITCPLLMLQASKSKRAWQMGDAVVQEVKKYPKSKILELYGNHDDFSNKPEPWALAITEFLCAEHSKL